MFSVNVLISGGKFEKLSQTAEEMAPTKTVLKDINENDRRMIRYKPGASVDRLTSTNSCQPILHDVTRAASQMTTALSTAKPSSSLPGLRILGTFGVFLGSCL